MRKILQVVRNIILVGFAAVVGPSVYSRMSVEPVFIVLFGMAAGFGILSLIELVLIGLKVKRKVYYYFNAIVQLVPAFILAGLFPPVGIPVLLMNIAIIVLLKKERPQEPAKNPKK